MIGLQALLWDVDGTIAETERDGHRVAFNQAFAAAGVPWRWDEATYGRLLHITGGRERLLHDMASRASAPVDMAAREALARRLHAEKNEHYAAIVAQGGTPARPGVLSLMAEAREAGLRQAIVTTTSRANVEALMSALLGSAWRENFDAIVCGEDVQHKKPHPEAYQVALANLGLPAAACLALEDSSPGLSAARAAGVSVVLCRSVYFSEADAAEALAACSHLGALPGTGSVLARLRVLGEFSAPCPAGSARSPACRRVAPDPGPQRACTAPVPAP